MSKDTVDKIGDLLLQLRERGWRGLLVCSDRGWAVAGQVTTSMTSYGTVIVVGTVSNGCWHETPDCALAEAAKDVGL